MNLELYEKEQEKNIQNEWDDEDHITTIRSWSRS